MATVTAIFTLTRDNFAEESSLDYKTTDGTAKAGVDYVAKSGRIVMTASTVQVQIPIDVYTKPKGTPPITFFLDLSNPSKYRKLITKIARLRAVCTIYTTDAGPIPVISISDAVLTTV
ncbi:hypothetical protein pEaSNUABM56_00100 [Erwinia phage pEa_SNUABM_56]|uniref:Putative tail fiber protein n=1 Tax=Erwinia phage pEp_SNUABM_01 TaxID=2601643 RepID=A0A5J6DAJ5_9CAUD|nr:putative tail fiber protein [Erwinia phage pEp_SNUABM_01]QEQ94899.1 putative tail fiber protein [Erwinia phage pEp_SNUABM_01]UYL84829.1 hypothetical protein pEaSNUABM55_00031 [Erwinia phage pEa_SNUABM_55]UYL85145.1 hypothetical protein pEaSNUABM56_00100 [Erwinia phage pEa_SNUABM_56]